ncbi:unnamed protein product, partial [Ranitomeya imitator]
MRAGNRKPELYRWRRQSTEPKTKAAFDYDNVEHWIKRVEQASEFAVSEVFSPKKPTQRAQRPPHPSLTLQSVDQLHDHDDAYTEAQDLLSGWLSNKLKVELVSDDDDDPEVDIMEPSRPSPPEFIKYSRFDDLYNYLEKETESANTQDFLQTLLQKEVADSGILESLKSEKITNTKQKDLRVTMELRHQQVKENRARRQRETERRRQELALKKSALSEAQTLLQEENKQKALKAKKEEEEIQREMVKLRKEMDARRRVMEEARRAEVKRKKKKEVAQPASPEPEERLAKRGKIQELLHQIYAENHRCLQNHFSAWYKLVLERRVKMGKARALADWRLQLRTFRAWRDHMWSGKMERETRQMEKDLRDQNRNCRPPPSATATRLLRRCLAEWQLWCRGEKEKRELEAQKEETKRKMAALLDAASSVGGRRQSNEDQTGVTVSSHEASETQVETGKSAKTEAPITSHKTGAEKPMTGPRYAWQVTLQHASLTPEELQQHRLQHRSAPQGSGHHRKILPYGENFENRHTFQQNLIEEQRRQLQEQKEMILGLMENQRLMIAQREAKNASAVTAELSGRSVPARVTLRTGSTPPTPSHPAHETPPRLPLSSKPSEWPNTSPPHSTAPRRNGGSSTPHPAPWRRERRSEQKGGDYWDEMRRRREEEKLAELRAAEEQRLQMELAEKEARSWRRRGRRRGCRDRAERHNEQRLLRSCGLEPWRKLLVQRRQNAERAESHHCRALLRRGLLGWSQAARELLSEKVRRAEQLHTTLLLRRIFRHWLKYKDYLSVQEERAVQRHRANLQRRTFLSWLNVAQEEKMATWEKQRMAAEHNQRRILLSALRTWRRLPEEMRALRLQEERRDALRKRVSELLPDFTMNREMLIRMLLLSSSSMLYPAALHAHGSIGSTPDEARHSHNVRQLRLRPLIVQRQKVDPVLEKSLAERSCVHNQTPEEAAAAPLPQGDPHLPLRDVVADVQQLNKQQAAQSGGDNGAIPHTREGKRRAGKTQNSSLKGELHRHHCVYGQELCNHHPTLTPRKGQQEAAGDGRKVAPADVALPKHLLHKVIVHVAQREEGEAEEQEGLALALVRQLIIPDHQYGQRAEDHHTKENMKSRHMEGDGQQDQRGQDTQINLPGTANPRDTEAIRRSPDYPRQDLRLQRLTGFVQVLAVTQTGGQVTPLALLIDVLTAAQNVISLSPTSGHPLFPDSVHSCFICYRGQTSNIWRAQRAPEGRIIGRSAPYWSLKNK